MRLYEFAPSPERDDSDEMPNQLLVLANRWWNATDKQPQIEHVLNSLGWSIHQVESEDDAVQLQHRDGTTYFISADDFDPDLFEISDERLQDYLHRAGKRVDSRLERMAKARERLNKGYEIYHADRPAGSGQIVHRFEANTPALARQYYEKFIQNYESDRDYDLRLRRSTGIVEYVERPPALINKTADVDGIQMSINGDGANVTAYATSNGKRLGYVVFDRDGHTLVPYDLAVEERYRGQGIAAVMYDYVKSLGFKIKASQDQTDAGKYFWQKNRGQKRVWESKMSRAIEEFLDSLSPDDVGVDDVGPYRIHYEGFTDDCKSSQEYLRNPDAVYQQVFNDFVQREGGARPVHSGMVGDEDYPILYSIFKRKKVNEIARIPQSDLGDWGEAGTLEPPKGPVNKKELPGGSGYTYAVNKTGKGDLEIMIFDGDKLAAELDLFETQDVLGTWGVETIVVERPYRGQGLGKALYGIALSILKLPIEAGQTQTKHGQAMWLMLNSIPGVEVVGYNMVPTSKYQAHKGDKIVRQDKEWTRYTFPVKPGSRSMRSGRPGAGLYTSQATMIAKWTGQ